MAGRAPSPVGAAAAVQEVPTHAGGAEPQIEPPMPPGMGGAVPSPVAETEMTEAGGDQTPRARSAGPASFSFGTPAPAPSGAAGVALPPSPVGPGESASSPAGSKKRVASPSPTRAPRPQGDPWQTSNDGNAVLMAQMTAVMAAMQRTIDALTVQLEAMQSKSGGKGGHNKEFEDVPIMHHKDVDKPSKFSGQNWSTWSLDFMNFLGRKNGKWKTILQTIQNVSQKPFDDKAYEHLKAATKIDNDELLKVYKEQLYEYLKSYTGGDVHTVVISNNPENAFESWRRICDQGNSIRERPLRDERRAIFHPKQASAEGLVKAIAEWEKRLHAYVLQRPLDVLSPEDKIMCLEDLCPEPIQKFLADQHMLGIITTYEEYKDGIDRYFYQEKRWNRKKAIHQCSVMCRDDAGWCSTSQGYTEGPVEADNEEEKQEDGGEQAWPPGIAGEVAGAVMAIIKGGKGKGKFGKGKGKGNDGK